MSTTVANKITKSKINAILKDLGLGYIRINNGSMNGICFTPKVKGILTSSIGPMTLSSAHTERNMKISQDVKSRLRNELYPMEGYLGIQEKSGGDFQLSVQLTPKKVEVYEFIFMLFPTYTPNMNYDPSYRNYYLTVNTTTKKV